MEADHYYPNGYSFGLSISLVGNDLELDRITKLVYIYS
jgi:hypothetical protein